MRYSKPDSTDWVEFKGASELSMDELDATFGDDHKAAKAIVQSVIAAGDFTRRGQPVDVLTAGVGALTWKQWFWLRDRLFEAVKDELADPEA